MAWHLHAGTEAMYVEPLGRRTPVKVWGIANVMAQIEVVGGNGSRSRCKCSRLKAPTPAEAREFFPEMFASMCEDANPVRAEDIGQPIGLINNGMPAFFKALGQAIGGEK